MSDTTEIEKKSLEAHVELCAERYRYLEEKLETVEQKATNIEKSIAGLNSLVASIVEKRNSQLLSWGGSLLAVLVAIIGYLLSVYVIK